MSVYREVPLWFDMVDGEWPRGPGQDEGAVATTKMLMRKKDSAHSVAVHRALRVTHVDRELEKPGEIIAPQSASPGNLLFGVDSHLRKTI